MKPHPTLLASFAAFGLALSPPRVAAADEARPPDAAASRIDAVLAAHEAELQRLSRALDDERRAREAAATTTSPVVMSGYVQVDAVVMRQSSEDELDGATRQPLNENRFLLRRAHLRAEAEKGIVSGVLEIDANTVNGPQVRPIDCEASIGWPEKRETGQAYFLASVGLLRTPFGFEVQEKDNVRPFLERATVLRAMFPGEFDLGLRLKGGYRALEYALGILNGDPIGERAFPGRDPNKSKDLVGRVGFDTEIVSGVRVQGGASAVSGMGFSEGTPSTKDVLVWHDVNEDGIVQTPELQVIPGTSATPSQTFHRFAIGGDLRLIATLPVLGELAVRGEIVRGANMDRGIQPADPVTRGRDLRELGWYVGVTQELTRHAMIGVRYDRYNPDADALQQLPTQVVPRDASYSTLSLMAMARVSSARLVAQYDHNGNALGRTATGAPTTLADDAFTVRAQVSF